MGAEIKRGFYWHRVQGEDSRTQYILLNWTTEAVDVGLFLFFKEWKLKPAGFLNIKVQTLNQGQKDRSESD